MSILILVSFAGLGYLAFYIAGKVKMFDEKGVSPYVAELYEWQTLIVPVV